MWQTKGLHDHERVGRAERVGRDDALGAVDHVDHQEPGDVPREALASRGGGDVGAVGAVAVDGSERPERGSEVGRQGCQAPVQAAAGLDEVVLAGLAAPDDIARTLAAAAR